MENKNLKVLVYIFVSMVGFGLGLIAVSLFMSFMDVKTLVPMPGSTGGTMNASLDLFDAGWDSMDASPVFVILSYVVLVVGLAIVAIDASIRQKLKRKIKGLNYSGLAVTVVGFALLIVSIIITKSDVEESMNNIMLESAMAAAGGSASKQELLLAIKMMVSYKLGIGSVMAIIGGVIALIGSIMLVIPAFDPIKLATQPETAPAAPTTSETPAEPVAPTAETNDNNDTIA